MNSRMNIGDGISIPQEKEFQFMGSWIPVTPDKPMQRSNPIPVDRHGNQLGRGGWQELPRFSNGYVQDMSNYNRVVQNFNPIEQGGQNGGHYDFNGSLAERNRLINHIAGSYTQAFGNESAGWNSNTLANILAMKNAPSVATANRAPSIGIGMENRPLIPNWHSQVDNWRESNSANMLLADQFSFSGSNLMSNRDSLHQMPKYSNLLNNSESLHQIPKYSNLLNNSDSLHQIPQNGFPIPYNLNLPPTEADAASSVTTTFQLTPVTPVEAKNLENNQLSAALNFSMDESSSQEKEKQAVTSTGNEAIQQDCDELLQNIVDSSSAVISTPIMEKRDSDGGSDRGIDLNKTPQQKTPKRRKHRPKVIVEGKPKRIPKPATPKNTASKDNPTGKRKYVRKKGLTEPATQQAEIMKEIIDASAETAAEACRRVLKFDSENNRDERHGEVAGQREEIQQWNERASHLNSESQGTELSTRTISGCRTNSTVKRKYIRKESPMRTQLVHKSVVSKENPTGKRKYVRKKGLKEPATQQEEIMREIMGPSAETGTESCRRVLNFDSENIRDERQGEVAGQWEEMQQWNERALNLNSESQGTEVCTRISSGCRTNSTVCISQQNGLSVENQQPGATGDLPSSMNQMPADYVSMPDRREAASLAPTQDLQVPNLNVISRNRDTRHADPCQKSSKNGYTLMQQHSHAEGIGQIVFQARSNCGKLDSSRQLMCQSTPQSTPKILSNPNEARGSKREYCHAIEQIHSRTTNPTGSLLCQEIFQMDECDRNGGFPGAGCLESCKKKKIENGLHTNIYGLPCVAAVKDSSGQVKTKGTNEFTSQRNHILNFESGHVTNREKNGLNKSTGDWYFHSMASEHNFPKQHISSEPDSCLDRMRETNRLTQVHNFASQTTVENCNLFPPTPPKTAPAPRDGLVSKTCHTNVLEQKQTAEPTLSKSVSSKRGRVLQQQKEGMNDYQQSSARTRGRPLKPKNPFPIDEIIHKLNGLNLNGRNNQGEGQEQNAIVPYRRDGTVVPYQGEFIKKRKPRPKVDLDPETNRIWNLLMGKEGIEGIEGTDMGKEQWWENERKVFSGRADSFIARMHLVQGDRRFSKWKGSVVDSVIGVFLTQNVSDHLSSSAFMSLAARFPLKPIFNRTCNWDGTSILVEEPEVCDLNPNDTIEWHEKELSHPLFNRVITTTNKPMRQRRGSENTGIERASLVEANCRSFDEEVLSSQDSYDSSIIQGNGGIRSCSGSNSEADDPITGCRPNKINGSTSPPQMENAATSFEEFFSRVNGCPLFHEGSKYGDKRLDNIETGQQKPRLDSIDNIRGSSTFTRPVNFNNPQMQVPVAPSSRYQLNTISHSEVLEVESFEMYGEECISSWPSTVSGFSKAKDVNCTGIGQLNGLLRSQEKQTMGPNELLSKHPMHQQSIAQPGCHNKNNQPYQHGCQHEKNNRTSVTEPVNLAEVLGKRQNSSMQHITDAPKVAEKTFDVERTAAVNKQMRLEDRLFEQNSREQVDSTGEAYNEKITNIPKAKKRKADSEKKNAIDWDSLREQVQANGRKKEWSKDTMDTMDYEAVRRANVKEISDSIKERGMNNMLAERIKEFLDRLVRDHGSIDLEWLRDVPPEKAKDYLLSIRGLGLKSVECVRLLTLHHLAFPVDTNVGRIAVRLGWVPLQPLPESLQLHLLELYPILESIQKYLWPRLCKLDQRTLYELHYQMITFGKVFCTKSKPNCNACPMRGECRHFASAFASARLVLPGPEEKSIVSSTAPMTAERRPAVVFSSMPLPSPENSLKEAGPAIGNSEPIVEEPATPEQEYKEITESDIEDYDDPNEIPTIKLNIQEFTENLQQYMQKNMELQEGDLSKALVALNPEAPSIPTPKLKNVSRLRTEHHVYELPDSHPLLKGMDRREPDDPSPYLLAIWTPGETANSIQPPEQRCGSLEPGKLCNEKTCFSCNSIREANSQTVRGTLLIPCRTAMRGSFPLNGTYFQVNEVFADDESSRNPIDVPRQWIWNLPRRVVYFGTSVSTIFKGLSTEGIQYCFWKGFVCVRGFDQKIRAPRPLQARLHFPASKLAKTKNDDKNEYKK